jgi:hypothetical protein
MSKPWKMNASTAASVASDTKRQDHAGTEPIDWKMNASTAASFASNTKVDLRQGQAGTERIDVKKMIYLIPQIIANKIPLSALSPELQAFLDPKEKLAPLQRLPWEMFAGVDGLVDDPDDSALLDCAFLLAQIYRSL